MRDGKVRARGARTEGDPETTAAGSSFRKPLLCELLARCTSPPPHPSAAPPMSIPQPTANKGLCLAWKGRMIQYYCPIDNQPKYAAGCVGIVEFPAPEEGFKDFVVPLAHKQLFFNDEFFENVVKWARRLTAKHAEELVRSGVLADQTEKTRMAAMYNAFAALQRPVRAGAGDRGGGRGEHRQGGGRGRQRGGASAWTSDLCVSGRRLLHRSALRLSCGLNLTRITAACPPPPPASCPPPAPSAARAARAGNSDSSL